MRRSDVFGDVDEIVIGFRSGAQHELTVAVLIDHNAFSCIADVVVLPGSIDAVLEGVAESSSEPSTVEMSLADARAWIEHALRQPELAPETDTWPHYRELVRVIVGRLPDGGEYRSPSWDWRPVIELCDTFFATDSAAPFTGFAYRELLLELLETGSGDPLRWSAVRVETAIGRPSFWDESMPLEVVLDAPDVLRAFVPFAHAQSGIRDELTSTTVATIDALRSGYKREVLRQAARWGYEDAV